MATEKFTTNVSEDLFISKRVSFVCRAEELGFSGFHSNVSLVLPHIAPSYINIRAVAHVCIFIIACLFMRNSHLLTDFVS